MYEWSSCRTMTPIVVGTVALAGFHASVYFLAIRGASLGQTEVDFLPCMFLLIPGSAVVGIILSKTGRYCPLHAVGFVLSTLGPGLNVLLDKDTHAGVWAMLQIADAVGGRYLLPTLLPAVLASLPEKDVASTTGMYSFLRSFGYVWDITIPSITFQNRFAAVSCRISDSRREKCPWGRQGIRAFNWGLCADVAAARQVPGLGCVTRDTQGGLARCHGVWGHSTYRSGG
ncbi:Efflux pump FUS6 [Metarhizium anisopliae]|nr:Efflux pump FUS6 [Metarhizium anisopliae]